MKELLNNENYCYKIQTLLMKTSDYYPLYRHSTLYGLPPFVLQKNLDVLSLNAQVSITASENVLASGNISLKHSWGLWVRTETTNNVLICHGWTSY